MTPKEFKAWFEGFTEAFTGCPTKAQWSRIKERVAEIDGVDRYWPSYYPVYVPYSRPYGPYYYGTVCGTVQNWYSQLGGGAGGLGSSGAGGKGSNMASGGGCGYSSTSAMYSLGQADAQALTVVS